MLFWIAIAVLTAAAVLSVLAPLALGENETAEQDADDTEVYRDQLNEIDRDRERGVLGDVEAEAARTEIARRLLKATDRGEGQWRSTSARLRLAQVAAIVLVPAFALGGYFWLGAPGAPDLPAEARRQVPLQGRDTETLVSQVESHLVKNPEDVQGWTVIAPVYARMGRFDDAISAYRTILRLQGPSADRLADLGEVLVARAGGTVDDEARAAFQQALELEPSSMKPRFFVAIALTQDAATRDEAIAAWKSIAADSPVGAPWLPMVREQMLELGVAEADLPAASQAPMTQAPMTQAPVTQAEPERGPTAEDMQAASQMSEEDRQTMIANMVAQLAERLEANPQDLQGWFRLIRAYAVMDRRDDAIVALEKARAAFADNAQALSQLDEAANGLQLGAAPAAQNPQD